MLGGRADPALVCRTHRRLEVEVDGALRESPLIDVAGARETTSARAVWDIATVDELLLARAEPPAIGLSSIGAHLEPLRIDDPGALHIGLGLGGMRALLSNLFTLEQIYGLRLKFSQG